MGRRLTKEIIPETGVIVCEMHRLDGRLHRDPTEGPAYTTRTDNGDVVEERYYWHGRLHREDGPAKLAYDVEDRPWREMHYRHGFLHRDPKQGPAWVERDGDGATTESYYFNGEPYRDPADGPWAIQRSESGEIIFEQYCDAGEVVLPSHPSSRSHRPVPARTPLP